MLPSMHLYGVLSFFKKMDFNSLKPRIVKSVHFSDSVVSFWMKSVQKDQTSKDEKVNISSLLDSGMMSNHNRGVWRWQRRGEEESCKRKPPPRGGGPIQKLLNFLEVCCHLACMTPRSSTASPSGPLRGSSVRERHKPQSGLLLPFCALHGMDWPLPSTCHLTGSANVLLTSSGVPHNILVFFSCLLNSPTPLSDPLLPPFLFFLLQRFLYFCVYVYISNSV